MVKQVLSDGPIWLKIVMKGPSPLAVSLLYTCIALKSIKYILRNWPLKIEEILVPYYPAYDPHPLDSTHPVTKSLSLCKIQFPIYNKQGELAGH